MFLTHVCCLWLLLLVYFDELCIMCLHRVQLENEDPLVNEEHLAFKYDSLHYLNTHT